MIECTINNNFTKAGFIFNNENLLTMENENNDDILSEEFF